LPRYRSAATSAPTAVLGVLGKTRQLWGVLRERVTHADAGQMHLYLNYAREHWTRPDENPPVGLILCAKKDAAVAKYALDGLPNKVLAAEYRTTLPDEKVLEHELAKSRRLLETTKPRRDR
jgi:hypothetical protein